MEKIEALSIVIHAEDIGSGRVFFFHRRLNLPCEDFLDLLFIALEFNYGKKMRIEPFEVLRAALFPVVGVVLEPCVIIKDSPIEAKRGG